jgi:hypothetical protein
VCDGIDTQERERKTTTNKQTNKQTNKLILQLTTDITEGIAGFPLRDVTTTGETFPTWKNLGSLQQMTLPTRTLAHTGTPVNSIREQDGSNLG